MKKNLFVAFIALFLLSTTVSAQKVNTDSLSLVSKISSDQFKLGKLQNTIEEKTKDKQDAAIKAQTSADANKTAANRLGDNPQDKAIARKADNAAGDARSDAKKARIAANRLNDLNKDIEDVEDKIAKNKSKLNKYTQTDMSTATISPIVIPAPVPDTNLKHR